MTWKIKSNTDFQKEYNKQDDKVQLLLDFAMDLIIESDDPKKLPLTLKCPSNEDKCFLKLPQLHAIIFQMHRSTRKVEFLNCQ